MTVSLNLTIATDQHKIALDILQKAREDVRQTTLHLPSVMRTQIRLDMLMIGYEAVERKIKAGHPYGTPGATLGSE
jgi:hypothetical protein